MERLLGYPEAAWVGQPASRIFTPEDQANGEPEKELEQAVRDGGCSRGGAVRPCPARRGGDPRGGHHAPGDRQGGGRALLGAPIRLDGRILGAVAINTDITAEKRVEAALAQQAEELQQFAHVAGHDLQAPLRMIKSYAQLLARRYGGQMDPIADQFLRAITDGVDAMEQLTRGLLQLAQAGEDAGERTAVRVETVIDGVLAALQPSIEESGAEVICGELPTVTADRLQLVQLFQNLVGNALSIAILTVRPASASRPGEPAASGSSLLRTTA